MVNLSKKCHAFVNQHVFMVLICSQNRKISQLKSLGFWSSVSSFCLSLRFLYLYGVFACLVLFLNKNLWFKDFRTTLLVSCNFNTLHQLSYKSLQNLNHSCQWIYFILVFRYKITPNQLWTNTKHDFLEASIILSRFEAQKLISLIAKACK